MNAPYRLDRGVLEATFRHFRQCGCGRADCQVLWISPWSHPDIGSFGVGLATISASNGRKAALV
jgi:hypothetical protein